MVSIRLATIEDIPQIKNLMLSALEYDPTAFNVDVEVYKEKNEIWWDNYLSPYFSTRYGFMLLLHDNSNIVGLTAATFDQVERSKHNAHLFWVYVLKEYRGKGYSSELINKALAEIKKNTNIKKVSLDVNATQETAIKMYKKFGFQECGYYKDSLLINGKYIDKIGFELFI